MSILSLRRRPMCIYCGIRCKFMVWINIISTSFFSIPSIKSIVICGCRVFYWFIREISYLSTWISCSSNTIIITNFTSISIESNSIMFINININITSTSSTWYLSLAITRKRCCIIPFTISRTRRTGINIRRRTS